MKKDEGPIVYDLFSNVQEQEIFKKLKDLDKYEKQPKCDLNHNKMRKNVIIKNKNNVMA